MVKLTILRICDIDDSQKCEMVWPVYIFPSAWLFLALFSRCPGTGYDGFIHVPGKETSVAVALGRRSL